MFELVLDYEKKDLLLEMIISFWKDHNNIEITLKEAKEDFDEWTGKGHLLYLIQSEKQAVGFLHLASRGGNIDWLEHLFVLKEYRQKGIASYAIGLAEKIVSAYSPSLYIEVASRNSRALKLYRKVGYDCLNTITIRKDFKVEDFEVIDREKINDLEFEVRKKA